MQIEALNKLLATIHQHLMLQQYDVRTLNRLRCCRRRLQSCGYLNTSVSVLAPSVFEPARSICMHPSASHASCLQWLASHILKCRIRLHYKENGAASVNQFLGASVNQFHNMAPLCVLRYAPLCIRGETFLFVHGRQALNAKSAEALLYSFNLELFFFF